MKNRKYIILVALSLLLIIGYAALTSNIDIDGSTKIKGNSWDIHFENVVLNSGNVELDDTDSEAIITENDNTKVTYKVSLKKPGDFYEFTVDAKNDGSIDGMVNLTTSMVGFGENDPVEITESNLPSYLKYSVTYNNNNPIEKYHELKAGALETYKIRVEFDKELENAELPENDIDLAFSFDVEYIQSGEEAITTGVNYQVIHRYQKLDNTYEEITENIKGEANSDVTPSFRPKKGFDNPTSQTVTIKEDGTTKVTYTYLRHKYHLTLEDSEYIETETPSGEYAYETPITLKAKTRERYTFVKWNNNETNEEITFILNKDINIKPIYQQEIYKITLNANDGEVNPSAIYVNKDNAIGEIPTPNRDGYSFNGWFTSITNGERIHPSFKPNSDIEIFARWIENYDCTYNGELIQGAEYIDGQYTYRYMQEFTQDPTNQWRNIQNEGWGVTLTDKESTDPVTSRLCTTINNKPIVSMSYMFYNSKTSNVDTSSFNTSSVTNMNSMFNSVTNLENIDLSSFNTSNVTIMALFFYGTSSLVNANLDNWDLTKLSGSSGGASFFDESNIKNLSAKNWKIPTSFRDWISRIWGSSTIETIDVTDWDLSSTMDISGLFGNSSNLSSIKGINTWDTSNIFSTSMVFQGCSKLKSLDLSKWNTSSLLSLDSMFAGTTNLETLILDNWDLTNLNTTNVSNNVQIFEGSGVKYLSTKNWILPERFSYWSEKAWTLPLVETIDVTGWDLSHTIYLYYLFRDATHLKNIIGIENWDTSTLVYVYQMFGNCTELTSLDLSRWNTSNFSNASAMFRGTTNLVELNLDNWDFSGESSTYIGSDFFRDSGIKRLSARNWKAPGYSNNWIGRLWAAKHLETIDVTGWDLSKAFNTNGLFADSPELKSIIGVNTWNTSNVTTMDEMFLNIPKLVKLDLTNFDTSNVETMKLMFTNDINLETIYADDSFVTTLVDSSTSSNMFLNDAKLVGGAGTIYDADYIDKEYAHLDEGIDDPGYFSLRGNIEVTFDGNGGRAIPKKIYYNEGETIGVLPYATRKPFTFLGWYTEIEGGVKIDENTVINSSTTFYAHWKKTELLTVTFNPNGQDEDIITKKVYKYDEIGELPTVITDDYYVEGWYTGIDEGTKINEETIVESDITYYGRWERRQALLQNGSTVNTKMKSLSNNRKITSTSEVDNIVKAIKRSYELPEDFEPREENTISSTKYDYPIYIWFDSNTNTIYYYCSDKEIYLNPYSSSLFYNFRALETIEINNKINSSLVKSLNYLFDNCSNLKEIDLSTWDTSNVTDMSYMFYNCSKLEKIDLTDIDTSQVTSMYYMFYNCSSLEEIDVSSFNTTNAKYIYDMFEGMTNLKTIYASDSFDTTAATSHAGMFRNDTKLVGGSGTAYNSSHTDKNYAHIDGGNSNPGYFTQGKTIKITYNPNGGVLTGRNYYYNIGDEIGEQPVPTYKAHEFIGWYTDIEGGIEITSNYVVDSNMVLYARWREYDKHTISFDKNNEDATGTMEDQIVYDQISTQLHKNKYVLEGHRFVGWNTERNGTGTSYLNIENITLSNNITLYAQWMKTYTLTFDKNNEAATGDEYKIDIISGQSTPIPEEAFSNYTLNGKSIEAYNTEPNNSGISYYENQNIIIHQDTTLYAYWGDVTLFSRLKNLSKTTNCVTKYEGDVTDSVGTTKTASNVYFDKCSNKRYVIFGGFCWQVIRTTETTGVRLIYNGEPVDGKCISTREDHMGILQSNFSDMDMSESYLYADSYTYDTSTATFTLENPYPATWSESNAENLINKFTCKSTESTCSMIYTPSEYLNNNEAVVVYYEVKPVRYSAIGRSSYNALHYTPAMIGYMYNRKDNYKSINPGSTEYKYGNSFTYDETTNTYTLSGTTKTINNWSSGYSNINDTHYTCWNTSGECTTISYITDSSYSEADYFELTGGESARDMLDEMLISDNVNKYSSTIKSYIENWYKQNLTSKTNMLEDSVYCNDRTVKSYGTFDPDGGNTTGYGGYTTRFKADYDSLDLACRNITDQFAVSNNKAKLTYPIALLTDEEAANLNDSALRYSGIANWMMSPRMIQGYLGNTTRNTPDGLRTSAFASSQYGVRPVITLKRNSIIKSGGGSEKNPWKID